LLRKKLQPPVEDWIAGGVRLSAPLLKDEQNGELTNGTTNGIHKGLSGKELENLWNWAGPEGNRIAREVGDDAFNDVFTLAEQEDGIENVVTGLRRKFWESDDEEDEEAGEKTRVKPESMDVDVEDHRPEVVRIMHRPDIDSTRPMLSLDALLKFTSTGLMPSRTAAGTTASRQLAIG